MTIDEAIKELTEIAGYTTHQPGKSKMKAIGLGIEALKRVKEERTGYELYAPDLLPGETEE